LNLHVLDNWVKQWLVDFNPPKNWIYGYFISAKINPINLKFNSENLNQVDNHKHLGVTISRYNKWAEHINNICQKATKQIFVLNRKLKFIRVITKLPNSEQSHKGKAKTHHSQKWWVLCSFAYLRWRRRDVCNFHMIYIDDIIHNCMCVIFWTWKWYIESSWIKWNKN
jgi:hypothetical protein